MRIHALQHVPFEPPGSIEAWARRAGHALATTHLYRGELFPALEDPDLLVVLGGPMSVHDEARYPWLVDEKRLIERTIAAGRRVLGICLGAQLIAQVLGARVYANDEKKIGWFAVEATKAARTAPAFEDFARRLLAFHWHGETFDIPAGAVHVARSAACAHQAFAFGERVAALQFHLETTPAGARALIAHGIDELVAGRHIQQPLAMLGYPERFAAINVAMHALLDRLTGVTRGETAPTGAVA
jgi:GMP synthase-like glutamine amidotransferase